MDNYHSGPLSGTRILNSTGSAMRRTQHLAPSVSFGDTADAFTTSRAGRADDRMRARV